MGQRWHGRWLICRPPARVRRCCDWRFDRYFSDALARLKPTVADALVTQTKQVITVTPIGRLLLRNVAMWSIITCHRTPVAECIRTV
jgi:oxygen-independent coproporphyrinogen III oxidase